MKKNDKTLNMLLPNKLYKELKEASDERNISLASLVHMALSEWLSTENHKDTGYVDEFTAAFEALEEA